MMEKLDCQCTAACQQKNMFHVHANALPSTPREREGPVIKACLPTVQLQLAQGWHWLEASATISQVTGIKVKIEKKNGWKIHAAIKLNMPLPGLQKNLREKSPY